MAAKAPKPEKPKPIEIVSVKRTRKTIEIAWRQGDADFDLSERDNPLASFVRSLDALAPLVPVICHFPAEYAAAGLRVVGFPLGGDDPRPARRRAGMFGQKLIFQTDHPRMLFKFTGFIERIEQ